MLITAIMVALTVLIASLLLHMSFTYGELKGYERGLDEAEQIICEVRHEDSNRQRPSESV